MSPDGTRVGTDHFFGREYYLWDAASGQRIAGFARADAYARGLENRRPVFTPDNRYMLIPAMDISQTKFDSAFTVIDARTGAVKRTVEGPPRHHYPFMRHPSSAIALAVSADGQRVVALIKDNYIAVYDGKTFSLLVHYHIRGDGLNKVALSPDGIHLVVAGTSDALILNAETGAVLRTITPHAGKLYSVAFSTADNRLYTGADAGFGTNVLAFPPQWGDESQELIRVWNIETGERLSSFRTGRLGGGVVALSTGRNGRLLASANLGRTAILWNAATGQVVDGIKTDSLVLRDIGFSADGQKLLITATNATIVYDIKDVP
jgi:WD40 repeat protein